MLRLLMFFVLGATLVVLWFVVTVIWPEPLADVVGPAGRSGAGERVPPVDGSAAESRDALAVATAQVPALTDSDAATVDAAVATGSRSDWSPPADEPPLADVIRPAGRPGAGGAAAGVQAGLPRSAPGSERVLDSIERLDTDRLLGIYVDVLRQLSRDGRDAQN